MPSLAANNITIEYETFGSSTDPALLLVNGFTSQLVDYEVGFCQMLADRGLFVIRYDNRDAGLSTHFEGVHADLAGVYAARKSQGPMPTLPYTMSDMANDGMELLRALGIERAHIFGISMGGMLVQTMAIEHPDRVLSLTTVMSHTGEPDYGRSTPEANQALMDPPKADRAGYIEQNVAGWRTWSSKKHYDPAYVTMRLGRAYDRAFKPNSAPRQLAAILAAPPRAETLRALSVPTLVIHGRDDTLITLSGGERTAELIPGAVLVVVNDMGHDLPEPLWPVLVDQVIAHTNRNQ